MLEPCAENYQSAGSDGVYRPCHEHGYSNAAKSACLLFRYASYVEDSTDLFENDDKCGRRALAHLRSAFTRSRDSRAPPHDAFPWPQLVAVLACG